ncbi:RNA-binding protein 25b isoform X2 [Epinephelus lanceolatus]|uniref:RNA-binding protein 25b isoform X2 n=1 Tax=Epinephelus lanceolatus TaxID=310571 RepID=UPI0014474998|nr:RNA-binding protein 25b isoform X2 [Epinephelus lanceolatus]
MSFPPHLNRPLLPPPGMPPQFAGFSSGAPMIPVHVGIMTPTSVMVPSVQVISKPPIHKKEILRAKESDENSGPTTTVFVGNISEKASDMLIRQLLAKCGIVLSWKRVQGASGKLQAFGFCEYKEPESTLRALRLLHDLQIGDKNLLVKVDAKTKAQLDEWKAKKKTANGNNKAEDGGDDEEEVLDEETKKRDQIIKGAIDGLMREYAADLNAPSQDEESQRRKRKKEKKEEDDINTIDMEEDKRDLISREISKFRDTHKKLEEEKDKREKERLEFERERREREKERERERERRDREREKEREREREKERERERERDRDKDRDRRTRERERERDWERDRSRDRSPERSRSREVSRDRDREKKRDQEDEEEAYERRKLERKLRDKEAAYQERLKNWELRERKKARDYSKDAEREDERRREMVKEGKRLKEFLEDYDDDRDDPKYYRGSALQKRLRDREKEMEADERDRKREKEELEEIRQRLLDEGHPNPDAELRRMEEEEEERLRQPPIIQEPEPEEKRERHRGSREHRERRQEPERVEPRARPAHSDDEVEEGEEDEFDDDEDNPDVKPCLKPTMRPITAAPSVSSASGNASPNTPGDESPCGIIIPHENSPPEALPQEENRPKIGLSLKLGATGSPSQPITGKRKKLPVDSVFDKFDDEEADEQPRKRKLVPLDYDDDKSLGVDGAGLSSIKGANTEEKRKHIKSLIEKIPTAKPELFSYPLDWSMVDTTLMERRVRPWINKKIIEYIGEEEATLVDFVCSKVMAHSMPQSILDDVAMVLDEEAEVFIVKMWRLLIYETEAKKIGLVK